MPIRSFYTIEQFEEAFQRLAHSIPKFRKVACEDFTIIFYYDEHGKPRRITFQMHKRTGRKTEWGSDEVEWWSFTIEKKLYSNSPHSTKIDFGPYRDVEAKVKEFIQKLMGDTKPKPRFSLEDYTKKWVLIENNSQQSFEFTSQRELRKFAKDKGLKVKRSPTAERTYYTESHMTLPTGERD